MPTIKTKLQFRNLKGEVINVNNDAKKKDPLTLGYVLAEIVLSPHKTKNGYHPLKAWELAQALYNKEEVEVSAADYFQLKALVEENESFVPMITAQAIEELNKVKD